MKKALLILHQKRSQPGDLGNKLRERGFLLDVRKPCIGDKLPNNLDGHSLIVIFGGPMSANDTSLDFNANGSYTWMAWIKPSQTWPADSYGRGIFSTGVVSTKGYLVSLIANKLGIPTVYYDSSGKLDLNDKNFSHGVDIINNKDDLKKWLNLI